MTRFVSIKLSERQGPPTQLVWTDCLLIGKLFRSSAIAMLLAIIQLPIHANDDAGLAVVRAVVGSCHSRMTLSKEWSLIKVGQALRPGYVLRCDKESRVTFSFTEHGLDKFIDGDIRNQSEYTIPYVPKSRPEVQDHLAGRIASNYRVQEIATMRVSVEVRYAAGVRSLAQQTYVVSTETVQVTTVERRGSSQYPIDLRATPETVVRRMQCAALANQSIYLEGAVKCIPPNIQFKATQIIEAMSVTSLPSDLTK
jgi:hypothetical protein